MWFILEMFIMREEWSGNEQERLSMNSKGRREVCEKKRQPRVGSHSNTQAQLCCSR